MRSENQKSATVEPAQMVPSKKRNRPSLSREPSTNVETLENVIEDEPHFFTKIVDNDLCALTMITKHFVSKHGRGIIGSQWQKLWWQRWFHDGKRWWLVSQMLVVSNEGLSGGGLVVHRGKSSRELKNR
ncbi:hypothetical protein Tco_0324851 [Tanacetum coccineum]